MVLFCGATELCDAHRLGEIPASAKCPFYCDAIGCLEEATGDEFCAGHDALQEGGATPDDMALASRKADRYGVTLARLLFEAVKMVPLDEVARTPFKLTRGL